MSVGWLHKKRNDAFDFKYLSTIEPNVVHEYVFSIIPGFNFTSIQILTTGSPSTKIPKNITPIMATKNLSNEFYREVYSTDGV